MKIPQLHYIAPLSFPILRFRYIAPLILKASVYPVGLLVKNVTALLTCVMSDQSTPVLPHMMSVKWEEMKRKPLTLILFYLSYVDGDVSVGISIMT